MMVSYRQPFRGEYPITQAYGVVIPGVTYKDRPHTGIDYGCPKGTPILASADGVVQYSDFDKSGYGHLVTIIHNDNKATRYAHLSERHVVLKQKVKQGDVIGLSGSTGNSTGPHLHFEARKIWCDWRSHQDPVTFLPLRTADDSIGQVQPPVTSVMLQQKPEQKIFGGLCEVVCEEANIRDAETYRICGRLNQGAKVVVSPDTVIYAGLPYHKIFDDYMLIAEYDGYGTDILSRIDG